MALAAIEHRGPDDWGIHEDADRGIALGHRRLSIIDLSPLGHQPMASADGAVTLVYNGEIYNYRELRAELETEGVVFRGHSDTEVLLQLYLAEGMAMLPRLNGIFALALYDARSDELLLARDGLGIKPLYFSQSEEGFSFSSEIKALLPLSVMDRELDPVALHRYLTFLWCPGEGTPFRHVRKVEPGEAMQVRRGKVTRRWSWYSPPQARHTASEMSEREAVSQVEAHLREAVRRQMVADVPVGAFLSGGLDSSAIVAFARDLVPATRCFTIEPLGGDDKGESADLPYARRVAAHLGVELDVVSVDATRLTDHIEQMIWHLDEPLADPAALNVYYIAQLARSAGIKVLLSGAGGDDLFTGYRRHVALRYEAVWSWLPQAGRRGLDRLVSGLDMQSPLGRRAGKLFANIADRGEMGLAAYFAWARRADLLALYSPALRAAVGDRRAEQPMLDLLSTLPRQCSAMDRMLALEQRFFLADHNLIYTDKMSMAAGVEVRVPFLDPDLVALAARIPDRFKQRGTTGKWVLKKAMEPHLPLDVIYRPKTGFGAPLRRWIKEDLREMVGDILSASSLRARGLFDPAAVAQLIEDDAAGRRDAAYTIFSLLCIEIWCRQFVDTRSTVHSVAETLA